MGWRQGRGTGRLWLPSGCPLTCPSAFASLHPYHYFHMWCMISSPKHPSKGELSPPPEDPTLGETDSHTFRSYPSPLRTPAGHHQVIPSAIWCWGIGYPRLGSSEGDLRLSDLSSKVSTRTVQVEDNEAPPHLGRYNFSWEI